jgi:hypothetical protein
MSGKYLRSEEVSRELADYDAVHDTVPLSQGSYRPNFEKLVDNSTTPNQEQMSAEKPQRDSKNQFYREVLRQLIEEVGPRTVLVQLKQSKFKDMIKQKKRDLQRIAPDSVEENEQELYYWNTR